RFWASVSRSVRTPARAEHDVSIHQRTQLVSDPRLPTSIPVAVMVNGNDNYVSEVQLAYELGYRFTFANKASLDLTAFYNNYDKLRSTQLGKPSVAGTFPDLIVTQPTFFTNDNKGSTYGFELAAVWQMADWWRWDVSYSLLKTHINATAYSQTQISPTHKTSIRAGLTPIKNINLDFWLRYTGSTQAIAPNHDRELKINDYVTLDVRLGWQVHPSLEFSISGQNLLDDHHFEYLEETFVIPTEIPRAVYGKLTWQF
ncbi:MAG: TonB-dependent receptor, partial [Methylococcales bacterium]